MARAKQVGLRVVPHEVDATIPQALSVLCADLLAATPEQRPSAERALSRLGSQMDAAMREPEMISVRSTNADFVGREREIDQRLSLLREDSRSSQRLALVRGVPGIGKSSLLAELTRRARSEF
jgi:2-phosphoglycerate kinase